MSNNMKTNLKIQNAGMAEIPQALAMLKDAALWLQKEKNSKQWEHWLAPDKHVLDWIKAGFENNEFFFALNGHEIAGMFRLTWDHDRLWEDKSGAAGYIHSFTTARKFRGAGAEILEWIKDYCSASGRRVLRLDCVAALKAYYEKQGFSAVSEVEAGKGKVTRYEIKL
jgi:hypothetical protein